MPTLMALRAIVRGWFEAWRPWLTPWPRGVAHAAIAIGIVALMAWGLVEGLALRRWTWEFTQPFRFASDINRGYEYGRRALREGFVDLYDRTYAETTAQDRRNELNYSPLRLATMTWYAWVVSDDWPEAERWQRYPYAFSAPVLNVNTAMELAAAVGMAGLVLVWVRRGAAPRATAAGGGRLAAAREMIGGFRGWASALIAAALVWFNPASLVNAHGWPLWDIWVAPFFIWAALAASLQAWVTAGLIIGVGAMFKGQQLLVAPLFPLLAVCMGRPIAALRWLAGLALGLAVSVSPWLLATPFQPVVEQGAQRATTRSADLPLINRSAVGWVASVAGLFVSLALLKALPRRAWVFAAQCVITAVAAMALIVLALTWADGWMLALPLAALLALSWAARGVGTSGAVVAAAIALALFTCVPIFGASVGWLKVGLLNGTQRWPQLYIANAYNIPALLDHQFGFNNGDDLHAAVFHLPAWLGADEQGVGRPVTLKALLSSVYFTTLALCACGAARWWRRGDRRVLVAMMAPWLLLFTIMPQMHERYLLFAATLTAALVAVRWPYLLLCLLLSWLSTCMTANTMLNAMRGHVRGWPVEADVDWRTLQAWRQAVQSIFPGAAYATIACSIVLLCDALGLGGRRGRSARAADAPASSPP